MHRRGIEKELFETIAAGLIDTKRFPAGRYEIVTGRHEDHGATALMRTAGAFAVLVDEPAYLDMLKTETAAAAEGAMIERAMRTGRDPNKV